MTAPPLQLDNAFWRFSLAVYGAPGVAAECLALQEALEIDVNLLLFCAWLGAGRCVSLSASDIERAGLLVQSWHAEAVRPLRSVRQRLKSFSTAESEALRTRVKAIELDAEQIEQAMLFAYALEGWPRAGDGSPQKIVPDNVRIFLSQAGASTHGTALSTQRLVDAALAERTDRPDK